MAKNIEIEAKVLLTKDEFEKVKKWIGVEGVEPFRQINYYIDTKDAQLRRYGITLRIRKANSIEITAKTPLSEGLLETNQQLKRREFEDFINDGIFPVGELSDFLETLDIPVDKLYIITNLTTDRITLDYQDSRFSLDISTYNGHTDYELEMEGSSLAKAEEQLQDICQKAGVSFNLNTKSKQARAIETIK